MAIIPPSNDPCPTRPRPLPLPTPPVDDGGGCPTRPKPKPLPLPLPPSDPRITDPAGPRDVFVGSEKPAKAQGFAKAKPEIPTFRTIVEGTGAVLAGMAGGAAAFFGPVAALEYTIGPVAAAPILGSFLFSFGVALVAVGVGYLGWQGMKKLYDKVGPKAALVLPLPILPSVGIAALAASGLQKAKDFFGK